MAAGDLLSQENQVEIWWSDSRRLLMGPGTDYQILGEIDGLGLPEIRNFDRKRDDRHGSIPGRDLADERHITYPVLVKGSTAAKVSANLQKLGDVLSPVESGDADPVWCHWPMGGTKTRWQGRPRVGVWKRSWTIRAGHQQAGVEFVAHDPWGYSTGQLSKLLTIQQGSSTVSGSVVNLGDQKTYPTLEIQGPATDPIIANQQDSNRQIKLLVTLGANDILAIDVQRQTMTLNGAQVYKAKTDNQWWVLKPGSNLITYSRTGTTGVSNLTVKWRDAYKTVGLAPFDPTTIPGLALDLDASKITGYTQAGPVAQWNDSSGNARHATQGTAINQPWVSDRDRWLQLPGAAGAYASTPNEDANRTGNRARRNQASLEASTNGWLANTLCTISRSNAQAADGVWSLLLTATGNGAISARTLAGKSGWRVFGSTQYTGLISFRSGQAIVTETAQVEITWYDSAGAVISTSSGTAGAFTNSGWTQLVITANSPASAAYASIVAQINNGVNGSLYYVDKIAFHAGASTVWTAGREEDLQIVFDIAPDDWTPGTIKAVAAKWAGDLAYLAYIDTTGIIVLLWTQDNATLQSASSTVATGLTDGSRKKGRIKLDVDNGANQRVATFELSDDGATWTALGSTVTAAGATSIAENAAPIMVGANNTGGTANNFAGKVHYVEVGDQIDGTTPRANPNFSRLLGTTLTDDLSNVWTMQGTASIGTGSVRAAEVEFDGHNDILGLPNFLTGFSGGTVIMLLQAAADPSVVDKGTVLASFGSSATGTLYPARQSPIYDDFGSTARKDTGPPIRNVASQFRVYTAVSAPNDWRNYIDGDSQFSTTTNTVGWDSSPSLGGGVFSLYWRGRIKRVLLWNRKLTDSERQQVEEELRRAA